MLVDGCHEGSQVVWVHVRVNAMTLGNIVAIFKTPDESTGSSFLIITLIT